ncbi:flagellar motor switch protein FliN/FliY [Desulfotomaculum arcticum]|uniref:Flagellar motor switch protein FliN/FliY n=1 Tax=Desulfotruncus arcticus DSM 17038 TaxID=1121424 RepID=A0A1I2MWV5_9FIRM|nr:FliM/FliN family flagellar motor switch protein [Desulfotruncus arcticus]SFF96044.1 flagellar motor switch protein FliN/FliY [Desulfotomaculum arcticum] [Desulfotruncus arcticus DSM 17038]
MLSQQELDDFLGNFNARKTTVKKINYPVLSVQPGVPGARVPIELLSDVTLDIWAELGEATLTVREILNLKEESIIELEKAAGDTVNLRINGREFARGEVIIIGNNLGIRVDRIYDAKPSTDKKDAG